MRKKLEDVERLKNLKEEYSSFIKEAETELANIEAFYIRFKNSYTRFNIDDERKRFNGVIQYYSEEIRKIDKELNCKNL